MRSAASALFDLSRLLGPRSQTSSSHLPGLLTRAQILAIPSMPAISPSFPHGPYRFYNREFMIVPYLSDPKKIRAVESLQGTEKIPASDRDALHQLTCRPVLRMFVCCC